MAPLVLIMQTCTKCHISKNLTEYGKGNNRIGLRYWCKECERAHKFKYYHENKETLKQKFKDYYKTQDKTKYAIKRALRRAALEQATPEWANLQYIEDLYANAAEANELFKDIGIKFHVDHIVPLNSPVVCGLHVEDNLQILTAEENLAKSNKFDI